MTIEIITPQLRNAKIFLGPRPGKKSMDTLKGLSLTHCCTLLSQREGGADIEKICNRLDVGWVWLPVEGGRVEILRATDIRGLISKLCTALEETPEPRLYFHCSAGIHRTGFMAYLLLRLKGLDSEAALVALAELRSVTADQVGDERIALAEEVAQSLLS